MLVREKGETDWEDFNFFTTSKCEEFVAEKFAEYRYNQGDPCEPEDFEMCVEVLNDNGEIKTFDIFAEATIRFSAEEREGIENE